MGLDPTKIAKSMHAAQGLKTQMLTGSLLVVSQKSERCQSCLAEAPPVLVMKNPAMLPALLNSYQICTPNMLIRL
jgi:hypothetical protein